VRFGLVLSKDRDKVFCCCVGTITNCTEQPWQFFNQITKPIIWCTASRSPKNAWSCNTNEGEFTVVVTTSLGIDPICSVVSWKYWPKFFGLLFAWHLYLKVVSINCRNTIPNAALGRNALETLSCCFCLLNGDRKFDGQETFFGIVDGISCFPQNLVEQQLWHTCKKPNIRKMINLLDIAERRTSKFQVR
jgi:hypothetical protein